MSAIERRANDLVRAHGKHAPTVVAIELGNAISASDWDTVTIVSAIRREVRRLLRA